MRRLNVRPADASDAAIVLGTLPAPPPGAYTQRFALDGGEDALTMGLQRYTYAAPWTAANTKARTHTELAYISDVSIETLRQIKTFVEGDKV